MALSEEEERYLDILWKAKVPLTIPAFSFHLGGGRYREILRVLSSLADRHYTYRERDLKGNVAFALKAKGIKHLQNKLGGTDAVTDPGSVSPVCGGSDGRNPVDPDTNPVVPGE
jgi:hypothetical protein